MSSDISFSVRLALIKMSLGSYESDPKSTSSNSSSAITWMSLSAVTASSFSSSFPKLPLATQHAKLLCCPFWVGPTCISLVGPTHLHNLYTILPLRPQTLMHWGVLSDSAASASFLFFFRANNSLKSSSGSPWTSSHLGTKVPRGFETELSQMEPVGCKTWFPLSELLLAQMARDLQLYVSSCHSIFLSHIDDRWIGPVSVCVARAFPKAHDMILPFWPHGNELKKL